MEAFVGSLGAVWDGRVFDDPHQRFRPAFDGRRIAGMCSAEKLLVELIEADDG